MVATGRPPSARKTDERERRIRAMADGGHRQASRDAASEAATGFQSHPEASASGQASFTPGCENPAAGVHLHLQPVLDLAPIWKSTIAEYESGCPVVDPMLQHQAKRRHYRQHDALQPHNIREGKGQYEAVPCSRGSSVQLICY